MELGLEIGKLLASFLTPIAVAILGVSLHRRLEGDKALVAKKSDFDKKWADEFFTCCQQFKQAFERTLALIILLNDPQAPNENLVISIQEEISILIPKISELDLRIRLSVVFAPKSGKNVVRAASECMSLTNGLLQTLKGNLDQIIEEMDGFNRASRDAYAEMLGLEYAKEITQAVAPQAALP